MKTSFTKQQLMNSSLRESDRILKKCVHCGFCNAVCPTYQLLGDELDGPRGRIWLMKGMLESEAPPAAEVVKHIDRCLSCLACVTTCPSGVDYMHLVDHCRAHIEKHHRRPLTDRALRTTLAFVLPSPRRFQWMLRVLRLLKPVAARMPGRAGEMASAAPVPPVSHAPMGKQEVFVAEGPARGAVGLLAGCVQQVLGQEINAATVRVLNRAGFDVHVLRDEPCCGAVEHHLGREEAMQARIRRNAMFWLPVIEKNRLHAIVVNASGCGTMLKDYGYLLRNDGAARKSGETLSELAQDVSEFLLKRASGHLPVIDREFLTVAYQSACSLQHGQRIVEQPAELLRSFGFTVRRLPEEHLCCGSAGTYNILQPRIAERLGIRKAEHIKSVAPDVVASGNLGCLLQLARYLKTPAVHTVQLVDWASGGPLPSVLAGRIGTAAP